MRQKTFCSMKIPQVKCVEDVKRIEYELKRRNNDGWEICGSLDSEHIIMTGSRRKWYYRLVTGVWKMDVMEEYKFYRKQGMKPIAGVSALSIMAKRSRPWLDWIRAQFPWNQTPEDDLGG